ncbi:zinc-binding metallopeptidase family protein [Eleftheria terrae]|uniref:zinc-binding metallopeptidase family protein n=1 Tax=Eleftheria terrae TaxID=1597781 RepID=UPI00263B4783|nr:putative zinc-binding metallopeptidase [Eleftheria terrae]WKB52202.1 putative zinc-binding peptidase [Eleftheria terrae]
MPATPPPPRLSSLTRLRRQRERAARQRAYRCRCGRPVFFSNTLCLGCHTPLGYEPAQGQVLPLQSLAGQPGLWGLDASPGEAAPAPRRYRRCANFDTPAGCNWLVPVDEPAPPGQPLCVACRLNRTIPNLGLAGNGLRWARIEQAKRRLVSALLGLGLPVRSRLGEDVQHGLAFDFLESQPGGPAVITGHADGIVTLDIREADDAHREQMREQLHEPYRTLLGHLRHEVGHYYWERLVAGTDWHEPFRSLFGDERRDYPAALRQHYEQGPPADWALRHVSAYASAHPWEDWAETWAHYLHMMDTLDTSLSFGLASESLEVEWEPFSAAALYRSDEAQVEDFLSLINGWVELTGVLNELSRAMGEPDFYPFVLAAEAVRKLHFVHLVVHASRP